MFQSLTGKRNQISKARSSFGRFTVKPIKDGGRGEDGKKDFKEKTLKSLTRAEFTRVCLCMSLGDSAFVHVYECESEYDCMSKCVPASNCICEPLC